MKKGNSVVFPDDEEKIWLKLKWAMGYINEFKAMVTDVMLKKSKLGKTIRIYSKLNTDATWKMEEKEMLDRARDIQQYWRERIHSSTASRA
ncbi:uncharacterized protein FIBRA_00710 [Fibroporia radiculosa]|uniref:Uncharacterized protein n=1 Tax=Fibroporia radiculosa TaxID=599839 RepID=J4I832_9APHY|nr:uncharacterized protein FIBRA_00710 [Fibroporia radiculosa]CCL98706.1 predicted protein [Fibroporia radiculosa]